MPPKRMNPPSAGLEPFLNDFRSGRLPVPSIRIIHEFAPELCGVTFTPTLEEKILYPRIIPDDFARFLPPHYILDLDSGKVVPEDDEGYEGGCKGEGSPSLERRRLSDASRERRRIFRGGDTRSDRRHSFPLDVEYEIPHKVVPAPVPGPDDPPLELSWARDEPPPTRRSCPAVGLGIDFRDYQFPESSNTPKTQEAETEPGDSRYEDIVVYMHDSR